MGISQYPPSSAHTHDDRYYTESETDTEIDNATPVAAQGHVDAAESTSSTTFADLATVGPEVTVDVGPAGIAVIAVTADMRGDHAAGISRMAFEVSGANTRAADADDGLWTSSGTRYRASAITILTGLAEGSTTFTAKYLNTSGDSSTFNERRLSVQAW